MIVDDNMTNLIMAKKALEDIYEIVPVSSGEMALEFLKDMPDPPDIVLLDVDMPDINGFYVISEMKTHEKLSNIPVVFLTAQEDTTTEIEGYALGAVDYIKKPFTATLLKRRVEVHLQFVEQMHKLKTLNKQLTETLNESNRTVLELEYAMVELYTTLMDSRSHSIAEHSKRVEKYMSVFVDTLIRSKQIELSDHDFQLLRFATRLHDMGKMCLSDRCVADFDKLSLNEKEFSRVHTILGSDALKRGFASISSNTFFNYAYNLSRSHHERWDGKGYPDKLMTTSIPIEARILSIVNSYDNFRTQSDGGEPLSHSEAINRLRFWSGTHFDPELIDAFLNIERQIGQLIV